MRRFLQLHMLTSYPPSNLNRDDLGRPKTATVGGTNRLRVSSQSLKRTWRTSDVFMEKLGGIEIGGSTGLRTKRLGRDIHARLIAGGIKEKDAVEWTQKINKTFGKPKPKEKPPEHLDIEQLAFISPAEQEAVFALVEDLIKSKKEPTDDQIKLLRKENTAADIALFGRMFADSPGFNCEAAAQVAHAFTVQKVTVEDDFFTAVDDLNRGEVDAGAGHMGDTEFASGVFYLYVVIDRRLLLENLEGAGTGSREIQEQAIRALVEAMATVAPTGKQNSFGSRAYAHYILAELGDKQPRSLSMAFLNHITGDIGANAIEKLTELHEQMDAAYDRCVEDTAVLNVAAKQGTLKQILDFCVGE